MEYVANVFLDAKEVNSVLCSEQKPDPACCILKIASSLQREGPKPFPEGSRCSQRGAFPELMHSFGVSTDFSYVEL